MKRIIPFLLRGGHRSVVVKQVQEKHGEELDVNAAIDKLVADGVLVETKYYSGNWGPAGFLAGRKLHSSEAQRIEKFNRRMDEYHQSHHYKLTLYRDLKQGDPYLLICETLEQLGPWLSTEEIAARIELERGWENFKHGDMK
jgi:hypothetical protein